MGTAPVTYTAKSDVPWLTAQPQTGAVAPDGSDELKVTANPSTLNVTDPNKGITGIVTVTATAPGGATVKVSYTVKLIVQGTVLTFDPPTPIRITMAPNTQQSLNAKLLSTGGDPVNVKAETDAGSWLSVSPPSGNPALSFTLSVNTNGMRSGVYYGRIGGTAPIALRVNLPVELTVATSDLKSSPPSLTFKTSTSGAGVMSQLITITESGSSTIPITVSALSSGNWLDVTPKKTTTNVQLVVSVDASKITAYPATGSVIVAPDNGNPIQVNVTVSAEQPVRRTLAQIAAGGVYTTSITLVNNGSGNANVSLQFHKENSDHSTSPWSVPMMGNVSTDNISIVPGKAYTVQTAPQNDLSQGWAEVISNQPVDGFAVFRQSVPGRPDQEAAVPVNLSGPARFLMPFDNTNGFHTTMAIANLSDTQPTGIAVAFRDVQGKAISTRTLRSIPAQGHYAFRLADEFSETDGKEGMADFTIQSGQASVVGLRFNPTNSFTSFEAQAPDIAPSTSTGSVVRTLPQIAAGGVFTTTITLTNTDARAVNVSLRFHKSTGADTRSTQPWIVPMVDNQPTDNLVIQPGNVYTLQTAPAPGISTGWAEIIADGDVGGFAVFRQSIAGRPDQEAAVPINTGDMQRFLLPFDNANGFRTTMAVANLSPTDAANVTVTFWDSNGNFISSAALKTLPAQGHFAFRLIDEFGGLDGKQGVAEFSSPNGRLSALGLRFNPTNSFTSFRVTPY